MYSESRTLAVLIDAENVELPLIERVLAEANRHGTVKVSRAYGNWKSRRMSKWVMCLNLHNIKMVQPEQASAKNSADCALIQDAEVMLRPGEVDGFCIVASDNDYSGLVAQIRYKKAFVMGIGTRDNSPSFSGECDVFKYAECLPRLIKPADAAYDRVDIHLIDKIHCAIDSSPPLEGGWVRLADVTNRLSGLYTHHYCHKKILPLIETYPEEFAIREGETDGNSVVYYVKPRRAHHPPKA